VLDDAGIIDGEISHSTLEILRRIPPGGHQLFDELIGLLYGDPRFVHEARLHRSPRLGEASAIRLAEVTKLQFMDAPLARREHSFRTGRTQFLDGALVFSPEPLPQCLPSLAHATWNAERDCNGCDHSKHNQDDDGCCVHDSSRWQRPYQQTTGGAVQGMHGGPQVHPAIVEAAIEIARNPLSSASCAGLRYIGDDAPGIRRVKMGRGVRYVDPTGSPLRSVDELRRITALAIPPAWTQVWICPYANGHIQATGRDGRGRKQYRYHRHWREVRDEAKYERMLAFAARLPAIRARTARDLGLAGLPRDKVLATAVRLLETTLIRVGNEEYARENQSFGLTTLRDKHVKVNGSTVRFRFRGKSGKLHVVEAHDPRLARVVQKCQELPGHELFQYVDDQGGTQTIESADVNAYLREASGEDFSAKDFRTWHGTLLVARALRGLVSDEVSKRGVARAIERAAERLGNTPAVCRKSYVHPALIACYLRGDLPARCAPGAEEAGLVDILENEVKRSATSLVEKLRRSIRREKARHKQRWAGRLPCPDPRTRSV
jgi:DNA topoisomerase-1